MYKVEQYGSVWVLRIHPPNFVLYTTPYSKSMLRFLGMPLPSKLHRMSLIVYPGRFAPGRNVDDKDHDRRRNADYNDRRRDRSLDVDSISGSRDYSARDGDSDGGRRDVDHNRVRNVDDSNGSGRDNKARGSGSESVQNTQSSEKHGDSEHYGTVNSTGGTVGGRNNNNHINNNKEGRSFSIAMMDRILTNRTEGIEKRLEIIEGMIPSLNLERSYPILGELKTMQRKLAAMTAKRNNFETEVKEKIDRLEAANQI